MKNSLKIILFTAISLVLLSSCKVKNTPNNSHSDDQKNAIYAPGIETTLIVPAERDYDGVVDVFNEIYSKSETLCRISDDSLKVGNHEIVFGDANREISRKAKQILTKAIDREATKWESNGENTAFLSGYTIYAEGSSVAIVWTDDVIHSSAISYFIENYMINDSLKLEDGYKKTVTFDYIEYLREDEQQKRNESLKLIENTYGADTATALEEYLSLFDERFYLWLADLYEPGEYDENGNPLGGGFYYSNSGRNTFGYGIDLESTAQAISFLTSSGMAKNESQLRAVLPESMFREIAAFAKSCQSPLDGYFYHPQWGINVGTSRLSRDLGWATRLLALCGERPYWNTPNGVPGALGAPGVAQTSALCGRLSQKTAFAVSRVIPAASTWTGSYWLADVKAWEEYVLSYKDEIRTSSYRVGNNFDAQKSQILAREEMAIANGELPDANNDGIAEGGYIQIFEKHFNQWQLSSNGLWEECSASDGTVYYAAINGLMKISAIYNNLGIKLNYADKAFECAAYVAKLIGRNDDGSDWTDSKGKVPSDVVDVYNPWAAMSYLVANNNKFSGAGSALHSTLKENAAELIDVTMRKIAKFKKDDGSFGYCWEYPPSTSQGAPVSVPYVVEGDVNGGTIAVVNTLLAMCSTLGIKTDLKPYAYSDLLIFADRIESLGPVIKTEGDGAVDVKQYTFDEESVDTTPNSVISKINKNSKLLVAEDPDNKLNRYVKYDVAPGGNHIYFNTNVATIVSANVFEFKIKFEEITAGSGFQIKLGDSYMFTVSANTAGILKIGDLSNTSAGIANSLDAEFDAYSWNTIRVEFYVLDPETNSTMAHIYVNDELRFASNNYYKKETDAKPIINYRQANIYSLSSSDCVVLIDDVSAYQISSRYEDKPVVNPDRIKHFDNVTPGGDLPYGVTTEGGEVVASPTEENKDNNIFVLNGKDKSVSVKSSVLTPTPNCYSVSLKMKIETEKFGVIGNLNLAGVTLAKSIIAYEMAVYEYDEAKYVRFTEIDSEGKYGNSYVGIPVGEWFTITIEFYPYFYQSDVSSIVYLNGNEIGRGKTYYNYGTISAQYKQFVLTTVSDVKISLDDIIPEVIEKTFIDSNGSAVKDPEVVLPESGKPSSTPAENDHNGVFDFQNAALGTPAVPGLITSVNRADYGNNLDITIDPKDAANKVLMHKVATGSGGNSETFTVSKQSSANANCYVYEFDMIASATGTSVAQIAVRGKIGSDYKNIFQASLYIRGDYMSENGGTLTVLAKNDAPNISDYKDLTKNPEYVFHNKSIIPEFKVYGWVNIRFEVYPAENIAKIYVDDEFRAETESVYSINVGYDYTNAYLFTTAGSNMTMYLDNVRAEKITKSYYADTCDDIDAPAGKDYDPSKEDGSSGSTPSVPEDTTPAVSGIYDFQSEQIGTFNIEGMTGEFPVGYAIISDNPENAAQRLLVYRTLSGAAETVSFTPGGEDISETKTLIGEWDMYMKSINTVGDILNIKIGSAYLLTIAADSTSSYSVYESSSTKTDLPQTHRNLLKSALEIEKWYTVRVEYAVFDGRAMIKVYLDDQLLTVSDNHLNEMGNVSAPLMSYSALTMTSVADADFNMRLDNISASRSSEVMNKADYQIEVNVTPGTNDGYFYDENVDGTKLGYDNLEGAAINSSNILTSDSYSGAAFNATVTDGALAFEGKGVGIGLQNTGSKVGNSYVFETDLLLIGSSNGNAANNLAWFGMSASGIKKENYFLYLRFVYVPDADGNIEYVRIVDTSSSVGTVATLNYGEMYNVRFVYTVDNVYNDDGTLNRYRGDVEIYVDNMLVKSYKTVGAGGTVSNEQFNCVGFEIRDYSSSNVNEMTYYLDNTFIGAVNE